MANPSTQPGTHSTFTSLQIIILILGGLMVCSLVGLIIYLFQFQPTPSKTVVLANPPEVKPSLTPKPLRTFPPTFTPQAGPTLRFTPTPTTSLPTPLPPQACISPDAETQQGTVIAILDGQTIEVVVQESVFIITYAGISAPPEFSAHNSALVAGEQVILAKDPSQEDQVGGQMLRYVLAGDRFINYELVRKGYALALDLPELSCHQVLQQAELQAQADQVALWAPTRIPTLTFVATVGTNPADLQSCDCSVRWTCSDFRSQARAQACYNSCNDYNSRLDEDHDGLACED